MDTKLMLHCGGKNVNRQELDLIPVPAATDTYQPVSHFGLTSKLLTITQDILTGFELMNESYGVAREGQQLFGVLQFKNGTDMSLAIGFRNSYDKSMSVGLCCGASVFVCDNLAMSGEIVVMRKHTRNVWSELEEKAITTCYRATHTYKQITEDAEKFKAIGYDDDMAYGKLGILYGRDIVSPRQLTVAVNEWRKPSHDAFAPRNAWSLYNAVTESLKTSPPQEVMERHVNLHDYFKGQIIDVAA
jgi:hypothetical protein